MPRFLFHLTAGSVSWSLRGTEDGDGGDDAFSELSAREIQVLRLIALGKSNKEIATILVRRSGLVRPARAWPVGAAQTRTVCGDRTESEKLLPAG